MKKAFVAVLILAGYILFSLAQNPSKKNETRQEPKKSGSKNKDTVLVDYTADVMLNRGDNIIRLVGNVIFHHNGAIIECDSALRYDDKRMEFFGKVLISQDSTYIYGDKVYYNGETSLADVFAPIIKMIKGDVTLYTYNMSFNTKLNLGKFWGGGVVTQRDNLMESDRGEYNSKTNIVKFLDRVSMRSDTYLIRTDSISYNLDAEQATFLAKAYIWDQERDFLSADRGDYYAKDSTYVFTRDAYVMTDDREMWSDTIRYVSPLKQAFMQSNAQVLDTANSVLMFGDWGFYDDSLDQAIMTKTPSVRGWQSSDSTDKNQIADTTYMRADSIFLFTLEPGQSKEGVFRQNLVFDSLFRKDTSFVFDTLDTKIIFDTTYREVVSPTATDSAAMDSIAADSAAIDSINTLNTLTIAADSSISIRADSIEVPEKQITPLVERVMIIDTLQRYVLDTLSFSVRDTMIVTSREENDTIEKERVVKAYYNVKIWNKDYQTIADSTISYSVDSTAIMFGRPIMWNEDNQITSDQIDIYTKNEEMDWADFIGSPFIAQQALKGDTVNFNQASGKRLKTYFRKNEVDRAILTGNVLNLYYKDEDEALETFASISCAELTILFTNREPTRMIWRGTGSATIFPIDKIPPTEPRYLEGFKWQDNLRPKSAREICTRIERPSIRSIVEGYEKPSFSISLQLEAVKERLLKEGTWTDRDELPRVGPQYFQDQNNMLF